MYSLLLSLFTFVFVAIYFRLYKSREWVNHYINSGDRCYSCKEMIPETSDSIIAKISSSLDEEKQNLKLCKSCDRDRGINILLARRFDSVMLSIRRFVLSDRCRKIQKWVLISNLCLPFFDIILFYLFGIKNNLTLVCSVVNYFVWIIIIFHLRASTIKKGTKK